MQFRRDIRKPVNALPALALLSLLLSACSHTPVKGASAATPLIAPASTPLARQDKDNAPSEAPAGYYDTQGNAWTQDEIDEMLGVTEMEPVTLSPEELAKFGNLWDRVRAGFRMNLSVDNPRIAVQRNWFSKRQDYLDRMTARASHYLYHTVTEAEKRGIPVELALLPVIESSYDPFAYSPAQAAGMWQFIPGTGKIYGLKQNYWYDGRRDVTESTRAAYTYLSQLYAKYGSWELVLAAYNAGPGTIDRAINKNAAAGLPTDYWSLDLPGETMAYVPRFLAVAQLVLSPQTYGITLNPIVNQPQFRVAKARSQVDLSQVAKLAGLTLKQLYQLNPGYTRWATDPDEAHTVLVPVGTPTEFDDHLAALPPAERLVVQRYQTRKKDTLAKIAARFHVSPENLRHLNRTAFGKKGKVPAGRWLVISQYREKADYYDKSSGPAPSRVARVNNTELVQDVADSRADATASPDAAPVDAALASVRPQQAANADTAATSREAGKDKADAKAPSRDVKSGKETSDTRLAANRKPVDKSDSFDRRRDKEYHKVRPGETLFSIARAHDVPPKDLARWNDMKYSDSLRPGKKLLILLASSEEADTETPAPAVAAKDAKDTRETKLRKGKGKEKSARLAARDRKESQDRADKDSIKRIKYEVRRGDTLYSISRRYNVSVSQIQTWNKGSRNIRPGQDLVLYLAKN